MYLVVRLPPSVLGTTSALVGAGQSWSNGEHSKIDAYPGLAAWTRAAEHQWITHGDSKMTLTEQIDHMRKLTQQLPVPPVSVAYAASGMHVSAALVTDRSA
jgi:hypothetical protein